MDELINLVVQKTGISQDDARKAVEVIVSALKSKLPGPIAGHLDSFISGGVSGGIVDRHRPDRSTLKKRQRAGTHRRILPPDGKRLPRLQIGRTSVIRSSPPYLLL
jgi:uncharacterized protein (DUF2267 family)